ncbi:MAG: deoxyribonuclease IV [Tepidiformaceae bacterium]
MSRALPLVGAHVSSAGGPHNVFPKALEIGAEAVQMFISAPQQWKAPALKEEHIEAFLEAKAEANLPVFFHGVYLMNFGSQDAAILEKSVTSLAGYMRWADRLGARGTIFHAGSHLGLGFEAVLPQMSRLLRQSLDEAQSESWLILENNAGVGNCCGRNFAELGAIIRALDSDPRVRVCIDTCHAFAMGYDISTPNGCEAAMAEFEREIGLDRLVAVHANDSKTPLGGIRDRHENIGDGHIGEDGFAAVMSHPAFAGIPFLLEVPGIDKKGPDAENITRLKRIRDQIAGVPPAKGKKARPRQKSKSPSPAKSGEGLG